MFQHDRTSATQHGARLPEIIKLFPEQNIQGFYNRLDILRLFCDQVALIVRLVWPLLPPYYMLYRLAPRVGLV